MDGANLMIFVRLRRNVLKKILGRLNVVETKVTELHEKLIQARGFVTGMRFGAASVFVFSCHICSAVGWFANRQGFA